MTGPGRSDPADLPTPDESEIQRLARQAPVVRYLNTIIAEAVRNRASDIHLEPRSDGLYVRYRIDGVLRTTQLPVDKQFSRALVARVKVLANLDLAESRLPQDGRIQDTIQGRLLDFRISVLPTYHGEKAVLRLLDRSATLRGLDELGFRPELQRRLEEVLRLPQGMILVTGPTGSGKSTTLYAALNYLKSDGINITTIEDPIEYQIEGINQTQIHTRIGVTFASQLRAILRQDPEVILVGEIRDAETAEMAFRAALTGHLVLSTLHTNDAPGAATRLLDLGLEPFLVASSVVAIVAQRLVRLLCDQCKVAAALDPVALERMGIMTSREAPAVEAAFQPRGCEACGHTGYHGRVAVYELMLFTSELQRAVLRRASAGDLRELARAAQMRNLQEEGCELLRAGRTSVAELTRVLSTLREDRVDLAAGRR